MSLESRESVARTRRALIRARSPAIRSMSARGYRRTAAWVARHLKRRFPDDVVAIFLRRSVSMDFIVPGLSDIDLFFVVTEGTTPTRQEAVKVAYRRLARLLPILDPEPEVFRWTEVVDLHRENPGFRFRFEEGRETWQLLDGSDWREELPASTETEMAVAHAFDLKARLPYFNAYCLDDRNFDPLLPERREYLLFKLALDAARTARFCRTGQSVFPRNALAARITDEPDWTGLPAFDDTRLRAFVAHTREHKLTTSFFPEDGQGERWTQLAPTVLEAALDVLETIYARPDVRAAQDVIAERTHFYSGGTCVATDRPTHFIPPAALTDFLRLGSLIQRTMDKGADVLVRYGDLWVNLSIQRPDLGNCTAVLHPPGPTHLRSVS